MIQFLISLFGILIIYRNLSLLEKVQIISLTKFRIYFLSFQLPIYLFFFFKEQMLFLLLYIGIFLIILMFYRKIFIFFAECTYEKCHLMILDHLIILVKTGKSPSVGLQKVKNQMSQWQQIVFADLQCISPQEKSVNQQKFLKNQLYIQEVKSILTSQQLVVEQLISLRQGLKLQQSLRHKSRQATYQIRAQAITSIFIYCGLLAISWGQLNLKNSVSFLLISIFMFFSGIVSLFFLGGRIKWKT